MYNVIDLFILPSIGYKVLNHIAEAILKKVYCLATNGDSKSFWENIKMFKKKILKILQRKFSNLPKKIHYGINSRDYVIQNFSVVR